MHVVVAIACLEPSNMLARHYRKSACVRDGCWVLASSSSEHARRCNGMARGRGVIVKVVAARRPLTYTTDNRCNLQPQSITYNGMAVSAA